MSLAKCNRVHPRTVVALKEQCTLILSEDLISQIAELHDQVKGIEWSGILLYKTISGGIETTKDWVIEASEIIPMDVGNSTYTEYEIDAKDEYSAEKWMNHMAEGNNIGHIHTHHNMDCFFSGTDTSELHDNAPSHNYYLSLIVNFKDPSKWTAKVAITGSIQEIGIKKVKGELKTTTSWAANNKSIENIKDLAEEVVVDNITELLYTIDCNIIKVGVNPVSDDFKTRVANLLKVKKVTNYIYPGYNRSILNSSNETHTKLTSRVGKSIGGANVPANIVSTKQDINTHAHYSAIADNEEEYDSYASYLKDVADLEVEISTDGSPIYCTAKVKPFIAILLSQDIDTNKDFLTVILDVMKSSLGDKTMLLDMIEENFEDLVKRYFKRKGDYFDMHAVTISMIDILQPFNDSDFFKKLDLLLDVYLMPMNVITDEDTFKLTGIVLEDIEIKI